ncbi:hypothetical protein [Bacillus gaemokensis]|uniref:Uncharacterized protein n=1 Tax=Bacillus gaemokensis TaxID=574375 RepID=A0A073KBS7_9BACI|nr:hypothetical protein [Bacillus gaemokensis]KEK23951.1 hypothetical protein BAGA_05905 [Bacillus gaemokensis]KYG38072.1 hypothetical protein AZF08_20145 [Bacillus gaemokensis]
MEKHNHSNRRNNNRNNRPELNKRDEKPQRRKRVNIDRNTEVIVVNNELWRFVYDNPKMQTALDMESRGDEDYITVGDLRVILNSNRKILEGFSLLITEVVGGEYELEDVLVYLGLDKKYDEYFALSPEWKRGQVDSSDIKEFILKSNTQKFKHVMETSDSKLVKKIIETAVGLFKLGEFGDYQKMQVIRKHVGDEIFEDAEATEVDEDLRI